MSNAEENEFLYIDGSGRQIGLCSDNNCPCPQIPIPRNDGYFFIERRGNNFNANLTCEEGARLRNLDLKSAHEDAIMWWKFGKVPARESIKNSDKNQFAPFENAKYGDVQKQTRERYLETLDKIVELENKYNNKPDSDEKSEFKKNNEGYFFKSPLANDLTYPEIHKSHKFDQFLESNPPSRLSHPSKPVYKEPKNVGMQITLGLILICSIVGIANGDMTGKDFLIIAVVAFVAYFLFKLEFSGKKSSAELSYKKELERYESEVRWHEVQVKKEFSHNELMAWRKAQFENYLKGATGYKNLQRKTPKGKAEDYFHKHLIDFFGRDKIITDVEIGDFDKPYVPDFVYHDRNINVIVDIEIDEPYSLGGSLHIHYVGKDDERNHFFQNCRWIVIRFAEEQIIRYPERCCKHIYKALEDMNLHDPAAKSRFDYTSDLQKYKRWNEEEALELMRKDFREFILDDVYFSSFQRQN